MTCHSVGTWDVSLQSASSCDSSGYLLLLFYIHIDCNGVVFPMRASLHCEWGCASSSCHFCYMTCYTRDKYTSWSHCGSACAWKGFHYLQMSSHTHHKKIAETSFSVWRPFPIDVIHFEKNWITWPLFLSPIPVSKEMLRNSFPFFAAPLILWCWFQFFNPITWFPWNWLI